MKSKLFIVMCILCSVAAATQADVIIGGDIRNGNFNASDGTFGGTDYWENIYEATPGSTYLATQCTLTNNAYDGSRNAAVGTDPGSPEIGIRWHGQDTGYAISAGDVFDISYVWRDKYGWDDLTEQIEVSLFVTDTGDLTGAKTILVADLGGLSGTNDAWEAVDHDGIYTATAADAGKILMVGIRSSLGTDGLDHWARVDNFELSAVPEPATMLLLGLGSIVSLRRRQK